MSDEEHKPDDLPPYLPLGREPRREDFKHERIRRLADATPEFAQELIAFCRGQLSPIKCPRTIDFDPELPRHPTGKLYKRLIRDRYWGKRESRIV